LIQAHRRFKAESAEFGKNIYKSHLQHIFCILGMTGHAQAYIVHGTGVQLVELELGPTIAALAFAHQLEVGSYSAVCRKAR
jgi:hypothetical protein